ncbi:hypothetical protein pipiens_015149 [Culex pipiens pipiens]|uniref:Uncharacterized protein n=1 Tax=Culex pipiens pipiens TaxID=38569 RepID=A0ABD1CRR7_CULPP
MQVDQALWKLRPVPVVDDEDLLETRVVKSLHLVAIPIRENYDEELGLLAKRSSFTLIIRTLACVNRLVRNCRTTKANRQNGELAPAEPFNTRRTHPSWSCCGRQNDAVAIAVGIPTFSPPCAGARCRHHHSKPRRRDERTQNKVEKKYR